MPIKGSFPLLITFRLLLASVRLLPPVAMMALSPEWHFALLPAGGDRMETASDSQTSSYWPHASP
jgi:hypothetical protein